MTAYIEVYEDANVIKILADDGAVVEQFEVSAIHVEMPKGYITARDPEGTIPIVSGIN